MLKYIGTGIAAFFGVIIVTLAFSWVFTGNSFALYRYFAPKEEAVRRQTFEESKVYNEGIAQELRQAQLDFARAKTKEEKQAVASFALHEMAGYDRTQLPPDLEGFVGQLEFELGAP